MEYDLAIGGKEVPIREGSKLWGSAKPSQTFLLMILRQMEAAPVPSDLASGFQFATTQHNSTKH